MQAEPRLDAGAVESIAVADHHEVLLARVGERLADLEELRVPLVEHDLAAVDAAGGVAPLGEGVGDLEEFLLQTGRGGRARVGEDADANRRAGDAATEPPVALPGPQIFFSVPKSPGPAVSAAEGVALELALELAPPPPLLLLFDDERPQAAISPSEVAAIRTTALFVRLDLECRQAECITSPRSCGAGNVPGDVAARPIARNRNTGHIDT